METMRSQLSSIIFCRCLIQRVQQYARFGFWSAYEYSYIQRYSYLDLVTKARWVSALEVPPCYRPLRCGLRACQWRILRAAPISLQVRHIMSVYNQLTAEKEFGCISTSNADNDCRSRKGERGLLCLRTMR